MARKRRVKIERRVFDFVRAQADIERLRGALSGFELFRRSRLPQHGDRFVARKRLDQKFELLGGQLRCSIDEPGDVLIRVRDIVHITAGHAERVVGG